ncbi:MAG: hypothetical protein RMA76_06960 [Deltaproteobacteria bacterium]|jgi:hypothetical protein
MSALTRTTAVFAAGLTFACAPVEFDYVDYEQTNNQHDWDCPNDTFRYEMGGSSVVGEEYQRSLTCMGLTTRCPNLSMGEFEPGSPECEEAVNNVFLGTCVEDFFAAFDPAGACTFEDGVTSWANGARWEGDRPNGIAYDSAGEVAFIVTSSGILEFRYARPR